MRLGVVEVEVEGGKVAVEGGKVVVNSGTSWFLSQYCPAKNDIFIPNSSYNIPDLCELVNHEYNFNSTKE